MWSGITTPDHFVFGFTFPEISIDNVAIGYILSPALQIYDDGRLAPVHLFQLRR